MSIEQAYQRKKNIIEELKNDMEELFGQACQYLQREFEEKGYLEWESLEALLNKAAHQVKQLQELGKKGKIQYVVFSYMNVSLPLNKMEIKIDLLDKGFYLDEVECTEYYFPEILQKQYIEDKYQLYKKAEKKFIRLQLHELQDLEVVYRKHYQSLCGSMLKSMANLIRETVKGSEILQFDDLWILYGTYMDKAIKL